jgi:hypothetical protein
MFHEFRCLTRAICFFEEIILDPVLAKVEQLRSLGWQISDGEQILVPLFDGGSTMPLVNYGAALFLAPGASEACLVQGDILLEYTANGGPIGGLGYPISDQMDWGDSSTQGSVFQAGQILQDQAAGCRVYWGMLISNLRNCAIAAGELLQMQTEDAYLKIKNEENIGPDVNWCGYALFNMMKTGGIDTSTRLYFPSTQGLLDFGSYYSLDIYGQTTRRRRITKLTDTDQDIAEFHGEHGSMRSILMWSHLQDETITPDIVPGDIVLLDHNKGGGPDHIQIVRSWHPDLRMLSVVDGNGGGFVLRSVLEEKYGTTELIENRHFRLAKTSPDPGKGISEAEKQDLLSQYCGLDLLLPTSFSGRVSVSCHVLNAQGQINPATPTSQNPHSRVFAIIRPAETDFESHSYKNL